MEAQNFSESCLVSSSNTSDLPYGESGMLVTIYSLLSCLIVIENAIILLIYKLNHEVRQLPFNLLIMNLALADFLTGLFNLPYHILTVLVPGVEIAYADITIVVLLLGYVLTLTSVFTVVMMCVDRLHLITDPVSYRSKMTLSHNVKVIILTWVSAVIYCSMIIVVREFLKEDSESCGRNLPYVAFTLTTNVFLPFTCLLGLNCAIIFKLRLHIATIRHTLNARKSVKEPTVDKMRRTLEQVRENQDINIQDRVSPKNEIATISHNQVALRIPEQRLEDISQVDRTSPIPAGVKSGISDSSKPTAIHGSRASSFKLVRNTVAFVFIYLSCWLPTHAYFLYKALLDRPLYDSRDILQHLFYMMLYVNSAVNPLLYACMGKRFATAIKDLLPSRKK